MLSAVSGGEVDGAVRAASNDRARIRGIHDNIGRDLRYITSDNLKWHAPSTLLISAS